MYVHDISLVYHGALTTELIDTIIQFTETKLDAEELDRRTRKKVFNVLVESLQNVYHHTEKGASDNGVAPSNLDEGIVLIGKADTYYFIITGNYIPKENVDSLKSSINTVNKLSPEELKKLYKETLNNEEFSSKGTAGLGIMDIARKSGELIRYRFNKVNDGFSFFTMEARIPRKTE